MSEITAPEFRAHPRILENDNAFKLVIFGLNQFRGVNISDVDGTPRATWEESKRIVQLADQAGIDGIVPLARWKNMGRDDITEFHWAMETLTWASALAAVTERIQIFATIHMPLVHPVHAAKAMATIDQVSGGRFGANLVAGWNEAEFKMFGIEQRPHDERYDVAQEWIDLVRRLWTERSPFDFDGRYYHAEGAISEPKPLQIPEPVLMSAGSSPAGRKFAARNAAINFVVVPDVAAAEGFVAEAKREATETFHRDVQVFTAAHVVCRDTEAEAREAFDHAIFEKGDFKDVRAALTANLANSESISVVDRREIEVRFMIHSSLSLVGTPEQIVEQMTDLRSAGIDGVAISWVDYQEGVKQYRSKLLPLMVEAGLRSPLSGRESSGV
jgi:FMNH2-dependent dimethyl sulfone monooxygenase